MRHRVPTTCKRTVSKRLCARDEFGSIFPLRVFQPSQSPNPFWSSTPNVNTLARGRSGDLPRATRISAFLLPAPETAFPCSQHGVNGGFSANAEGVPCLRRLSIRAFFEVRARLFLPSPSTPARGEPARASLPATTSPCKVDFGMMPTQVSLPSLADESLPEQRLRKEQSDVQHS